MATYPNTIVVPDTHHPHMDWEKFWALLEAGKHLEKTTGKVRRVIQVGDLFDQSLAARWPRSHNILKPKDELEQARENAGVMWQALRKAFPTAKCWNLLGNHDLRIFKKILQIFPEIESLVHQPVRDLYTFKGVTTMPDQRTELELGGICYIHGHKTKLGDHAREMLVPVVHGHTHRGGVVWLNSKLWQMQCGHLIDMDSVRYTMNKNKHTWNAGFGWIDKYGPRFIPL